MGPNQILLRLKSKANTYHKHKCICPFRCFSVFQRNFNCASQLPQYFFIYFVDSGNEWTTNKLELDAFIIHSFVSSLMTKKKTDEKLDSKNFACSDNATAYFIHRTHELHKASSIAIVNSFEFRYFANNHCRLRTLLFHSASEFIWQFCFE